MVLRHPREYLREQPRLTSPGTTLDRLMPDAHWLAKDPKRIGAPA
jgi:hypothetical protein